jgi:hypothetical protein
LKGRHFDDFDGIRINTTAALKSIAQSSSKIVLKVRLFAGTGTWIPNGSILKATTVVLNNVVCTTLTTMSSQNLLSHHVM